MVSGPAFYAFNPPGRGMCSLLRAQPLDHALLCRAAIGDKRDRDPQQDKHRQQRRQRQRDNR